MDILPTNSTDRILNSINGSDGSALRVLQWSVLVVVEISAVSGNLLALILFVKFQSLRTTRNLFSLNLSISDILAGALTYVILDGMVMYRLGESDVWGCELIVCLPLVVAVASPLCVLGSTLDRLIAVRLPLRYPILVTRNRVMMANLGIWLVAVVFGLIPMYDSSKWPERLDAAVPYCRGTVRVHFLMFFILGAIFYMPVVVTVFAVYCYIHRIANKHTKARQARIIGNSITAQERKLIRLSKSMKVLLALCITMCTCWLPHCTLSLLSNIIDINIIKDGLIVSANLFVLSPAINPWIFTLRNAEFKSALKQLVRQCCNKKICCQEVHTEIYPETAQNGATHITRSDID